MDPLGYLVMFSYRMCTLVKEILRLPTMVPTREDIHDVDARAWGERRGMGKTHKKF